MLQKIGALRTEFSIPSSKIFPEIEKYNPSSNYISYKKCCKKCGGISYRKHRSQFQNIFRDRKVEFLVQKYFLHKMLQKKRSFVQNSPFLVPIYIQRQKKYKSSFKNISYKKCCQKIGGMSYRIHCYHTKFPHENTIPRGQKNTIQTRSKKFPAKYVEKILQTTIEFCVTKYFLQKCCYLLPSVYPI